LAESQRKLVELQRIIAKEDQQLKKKKMALSAELLQIQIDQAKRKLAQQTTEQPTAASCRTAQKKNEFHPQGQPICVLWAYNSNNKK
jgi:hypothetical protein